MNAIESITWLESAIKHELAVASSWSLAGWPDCANHYRRNAAKAMRILRRAGGSGGTQNVNYAVKGSVLREFLASSSWIKEPSDLRRPLAVSTAKIFRNDSFDASQCCHQIIGGAQ